jgi:hypothetical protein
MPIAAWLRAAQGGGCGWSLSRIHARFVGARNLAHWFRMRPVAVDNDPKLFEAHQLELPKREHAETR